MELRDEDHVPLGRFTLSLGVAGFPRHAEDAEELGTCAEKALARARELGGNRLQVFGAPPHEPGQDDDPGEGSEHAPIVGDPASPAALADDVLPPDWDDDLP